MSSKCIHARIRSGDSQVCLPRDHPIDPIQIGLHRVTVRSIEKNRLRIGPIEAIDGTPVIDIKPALSCADS
ncbi:MAG TPA: TrmO family methyltransferase [Terriglobales bacterium]|nr:TrmO family methyltransferase [Terriglobales bacterium]